MLHFSIVSETAPHESQCCRSVALAVALTHHTSLFRELHQAKQAGSRKSSRERKVPETYNEDKLGEGSRDSREVGSSARASLPLVALLMYALVLKA